MKRHCLILLAAVPLLAQAPEISFTSDVNLLKYPDSVSIGEVAGVATDSKGNLFVYTRTGHPTISLGTSRPFAHGGSRLYEFDKTGKFLREIGQDSYGFLVAQQVRIDPQDNLWVVDQMSSMVMKFDANGRIQMLLGRKSNPNRFRRGLSMPLPDGRAGDPWAQARRATFSSGRLTWHGMPRVTSMSRMGWQRARREVR